MLGASFWSSLGYVIGLVNEFRSKVNLTGLSKFATISEVDGEPLVDTAVEHERRGLEVGRTDAVVLRFPLFFVIDAQCDLLIEVLDADYELFIPFWSQASAVVGCCLLYIYVGC